MTIDAGIFDLDGVVVNTVPLHFRAWKKMFERHRVAFDFQLYKEKVDGLPRMQGIKNVLPYLDQQTLEELAAEKQEYYLKLLETDPAEIFDDALLLISDLNEAGLKVAVASSSKNTALILKKVGLHDRFQAVVTGYDFKNPKPDPDIFLTAARKLGIKPPQCFVVEDAIEGVKAGKAAKMFCIGIARRGNAKELTAADLILKKLPRWKELQELLPQNAKQAP